MLSRLNPQQREAVTYLDGPLLVLAGAGSGKTRVITYKLAWMVRERRFDPRHLAALTFTNKAAREMKNRVATLAAGKPLAGLTVSTFHSLGVQILRREATRLGLKPGFSILDATDAGAVIAEIAGGSGREETRRMQSRISLWKNTLVTPHAALELAGDDDTLAAARCFVRYQDTLRAYQAVDFDDLLVLPVTLFESDGEALDVWQRRLRYLLVDEYQDTNAVQYRLLKLLAGRLGTFTAVGDDDQAIYAWRGADAANLLTLGEDYPRLKTITLAQNYRSSGRILTAANRIIANNARLSEKKLWSELGPGEPVEIVAARDDAEEAKNVLVRLVTHRARSGGRYADYAVLYRGNHQARSFEEALRAERVPYVVSGGTSFFERAEIKDVTAYLRLLANADDDPAFIRAVTTPRRGIGAQTLEKLGAHAGRRHVSLFEAAFEPAFQHELPERQLLPLLEFCEFINRMAFRAGREPAGQVLRDLLAAIGYEAWLQDSEDQRLAQSRWKNVEDLVGWMARKGEDEDKNLLQLTQTIALISMLETDDQDVDAVRLSTLHAAKGLEFPHVFLAGVEEGLLPHRESVDAGKVDEERRLMYVGITRARQSLTITYALRRKRAGEWVSTEPSRFLAEISGEGVRNSAQGPSDPDEARKRGAAQLADLKALFASPAGAGGGA